MRHHERMIMLSVIDQQWKDHLLSMDHLKEGIGLRGYGQHDPLVEYKKESFDMFEAMMQRFQEDTVRYLYLMQILERPPDPGAGGAPSGGPVGTRSGLRSPSSAWWRWEWEASSTTGFDVSRRTGRSLHAPQTPRARTIAHGRSRRRAAGAASRSRPGKSWTQRSLPLRLRQEIQKVPRRLA